VLSILPSSGKESPKLRLDASVVPVHYSAQLTVAPNSDTFDGSIDIDVTLSVGQRIIWLNAVDLNLKTARTAEQTAKVVNGDPGFVGLEFPQPVAAGSAKIHIDYSGKISRKNSAGIFQLEDGGRWYVYTQFEATDARRAFPCFDQPSFKTPWDISLIVPKGTKAFANTPEVDSKSQPGGLKLVRFATSRPLPSYLVAFAVGPFDIVDAGKAGQHKTPVRIIMPKGHTGEAQFAVRAIPELLNLLEDYFGTPYPYEKLDSVAMPISNFAMENVGLITYGSSLLLAEPKKDSIGRERLCAVVAAHEMAHQWFGDLVTTAWWDDIWLNEAFASWMETKIVERWRPEWHMDVDAAESMLRVMRLDRLASARKIRQPIESESDIANAFDDITYQKGAAVISMFEHWIGPDKFRDGVRLYLEQNADKSATEAQFLSALSKAAGRDVAPAFSSFLDQEGTPVVSVALECGKGEPRVKLKQYRYVPIGSKARADERWSIPVCLKYEAGGKVQSACSLLTQSEGEFQLEHAQSCPAWIDGNDREEGYYRVAYDPALFDRLVRNAPTALAAPEKIGLLSDAEALVDNGQLSPRSALSLVGMFAPQDQPQVITGTTDLAKLTVGKYVPEDVLPLGREFIRANYAARAERLGWVPEKGESDDRKLLRRDLVPFVADEGRDATLMTEAGKQARAWLKDRSSVDADTIEGVLKTAAKSGDAAFFDALLSAAKSAKDSSERRLILSALGSFTDPALVQRAMGLLLTGTFDLRESFHPLLFGPLQERSTERLPFEFVRAHIDELVKRLPGEVGSDLAALLPAVGGPFCDATSHEAVYTFFKDRVKQYSGGERSLAQTIERIDLCTKQRAQLGPEIADYLRNNPQLSEKTSRRSTSAPSGAQ
jgi:alanyl aminopeptidase